MAQESDSSTPSSSSKSGWNCGALATFTTKCNNDSPPFDSLWFRRHSKIHDAEVKLCSQPPAIYDFCTLLGKDILTSHHTHTHIYIHICVYIYLYIYLHSHKKFWDLIIFPKNGDQRNPMSLRLQKRSYNTPPRPTPRPTWEVSDLVDAVFQRRGLPAPSKAAEMGSDRDVCDNPSPSLAYHPLYTLNYIDSIYCK